MGGYANQIEASQLFARAFPGIALTGMMLSAAAAMAVGRLGDASGLPDDLRAMESPNSRKPHAAVATDVFPVIHLG